MLVTKRNAITVRPNRNTIVISYPSDNDSISIARISVSGRHPEHEGDYFIEKKCHVLFYILKGNGSITVGKESFLVQPDDSITIKAGQKYYIKGNIEYVAATSPAYTPEQNRIVKS